MGSLSKLLISERVVVFVIVLNTIALGLVGHTDPQLGGLDNPFGSATPTIYELARYLDYACVIYFLVEVVLKVRDQGFKHYWSSGWNRFDFIVVVLSIPVLFENPTGPASPMSVVLSLRLGRLFRLFRILRFIPNREHLYQGMKRALRASVGVFLALFLVNIVLALGATQLFGATSREYFGNPLLSMYSLFKVFTVEGWYEIPDAIAKSAEHPAIGVLARLYFIMSVTLGGLLGLGLANAVFVDEMTMDNNDDLETKVDRLSEEIRRIRELLETKQS
ncbi:MAG: ion transporter [Myxococcales bacterium]|nr:ion transporter [Myxococcales bacterium]